MRFARAYRYILFICPLHHPGDGAVALNLLDRLEGDLIEGFVNQRIFTHFSHCRGGMSGGNGSRSDSARGNVEDGDHQSHFSLGGACDPPDARGADFPKDDAVYPQRFAQPRKARLVQWCAQRQVIHLLLRILKGANIIGLGIQKRLVDCRRGLVPKQIGLYLSEVRQGKNGDEFQLRLRHYLGRYRQRQAPSDQCGVRKHPDQYACQRPRQPASSQPSHRSPLLMEMRLC